MRLLSQIFSLLLALTVFQPASAEETPAPSLVEGVKAKAQPLLKALSLLGTPYKFGGNNPEKGLDCSGFVKHVYKESADLSLPRSAAEMSQLGETIAQTDLKPGDLVFFNTRKKPNSHVGIYAGDGAFVHASSSRTKEVTLSRINEKYWATRFNGARRVLQPD
jgi:cell wall-associated NlpC family hydrolase